MPGETDTPDILADSVGTTACPNCSNIVEVSGKPAFSNVRCPHCESQFTAPGKLGHFILLKMLGRGEMGATYKAFDRTLGRYVAVKVMRKSLGDDRKGVDAFLAEGRALASLDHPNAVRVFSIGQEKGQPYIVMELITGEPLQERHSLDEALDEGPALEIIIQIARALQAANKIGLIHGDVKPANIMIDKKGRSRLVDFGIARFGGGRVAEGAALGTPFYVAPEQVRRDPIDYRTDIYSLGATLFHILACRPPFPGTTMKQVLLKRLDTAAPDLLTIRESLHPQTAAVVAKMLEREPGDRHGSHQELLEDLQQAHREVTGKAFAPEEGAAAPQRRRTLKLALAITVAAAALILAIVAAVVIMHVPGPKEQKPVAAVIEQVTMPVFSPPEGMIEEPVDVTIACDTEGVEIRYTTDGSDPTKKSPLFKDKVRVEPGATLKAKAYREGWEPSPVVEASYPLRTATLAEIVPVRTDALRAWQNAQELARAGGMQAKLKQAKSAFDNAEEFYKKSAYDEAKAAYEKLASLCKQFEKLAAEREPALGARKAAEDTIKALAPFGVTEDPEATWPKLRSKAKAAFDKGQFAEATRLWQGAAENAKARYEVLLKQVSGEWNAAIVDYDVGFAKKYAPAQWKQVEQALAQARKTEKAKQFPKAKRLYRTAVQRLADVKVAAKAAYAEIEKAKAILKEIDALWESHDYRKALAKADAGLVEYPKNKSLQDKKNEIGQKLYITLPLAPGRRPGKPGTPVRPTDIQLALIPAGRFTMGSPATESGRNTDERQHEVTISRPFYMAVREVTVRQFRIFVQANKGYKTDAEKSGSAMALRSGQWRRTTGASWLKPGFEQTQEDPVVCVTWNDAWAFCKWLSAKTKRKVLLPTEAQWEYACRAPTKTRFSFGVADADLHKHGNYADKSTDLRRRDEKNSDGYVRTAPVGSFKPNPWGLYDTHGNASEWCSDMYGSYARVPVTDPGGTIKGKYPVLRGGSWFDVPAFCRSAARDRRRQDFSSGITGFRVIVKIEE